MTQTIAFIGLGNMGGGMAANLLKNGYAVRAFDLSEDALARAEGHGATRAASAIDAVAGADAVVTMLPAGGHVENVYDRALFDAARPGALLLDCSTIDVATARRVIEAAATAGFEMVDAPVSGGIAAATGGTLTFMVAMAKKLGLDAQTFYDISSVASGQSWSMTSYCPVPGVGPQTPADNGYQGGFAVGLMLKDLKLASEAAASVGASVPMGNAAEALYQMLANRGEAGRDFSAMIEMLEGK